MPLMSAGFRDTRPHNEGLECGRMDRGRGAGRLQVRTWVAYDPGMENVTLPPELERFATEAVAGGRYRDLSEVIAAGVSLLQQAEAAQAAFNTSLEDAEAESERLGFLTADEVHAEMAGIIDQARRAKV